MKNQYSNYHMICHHGKHEGIYKGIRLAGLGRTRKNKSTHEAQGGHNRVKRDDEERALTNKDTVQSWQAMPWQ